MKLVLNLPKVNDEDLRFLAQLGVSGVQGAPPAADLARGYYEYAPLLHLRRQVESYGLKLETIGLLPWQWTYKWMLGLAGRDEQIENCQKTIRNMGAAGIPTFIYNMHALRFYRTSQHTARRGGALGTSFEAKLVENMPLLSGGPGVDTSIIPASERRPIGEQEMWGNLEYFLKAVIPVAEEAGVKVGLHPDDPPIPTIAGVARIVRSPAAYRRALELVPSPNNGVCFCQGCFAEMGADVLAEIRYFGSRQKIFFVHFRNVVGTADNFGETFPDDGQMDMVAAMKAYKEVGYDGPMSPDHKLALAGDTDWGHRYWAYAIGYMRGLLQAT